MKEFPKKKQLSNIAIFLLLFSAFFKNLFTVRFFADDYYFLVKSQASSINDFLNFFNPIRDTFYRPLSSEVFYFLIQLFPNPNLAAHIITTSFFLLALVGLYRVIRKLYPQGDNLFPWVFLVFYTFHLSRVYQLYWPATFQEVLMLFSLVFSFLYFIEKKNIPSILFFFFALLSKETALVYPLFLLLYVLLIQKSSDDIRKRFRRTLPFLILSFLAATFYLSGVINTEKIDIYRITLSLKLFINNLLWYSLWSLGLASFFPDYFPSLISLPLPEFYKYLDQSNFRIYLLTLLIFISYLFISLFILLKRGNFSKKSLIKTSLFILLSFILFLSPFLLIKHRWMIRLTLPTLFSSLVFTFITVWLLKRTKLEKTLAILGMVSFLLFNFFGVRIEEDASTYFFESQIISNTKEIFSSVNPSEYEKIIIINSPTPSSAWDNIEKLKVSFNEKNFFRFYFPDIAEKIVYEDDPPNPKENPKILFITSSQIIYKDSLP